ncbi:unnamed protein product, partial [marine sediment metagenome]
GNKVDRIPLSASFTYKITLNPDTGTRIGGTADLELWSADGVKQVDIHGFVYGYSSTWEEEVRGDLNEDFSKAHLFYSIIADRRGADGETYSATVGDVTINGNTTVGLAANTEQITAISVSPTDIDFGTITPGTAVSGDPITVTNIGQVTVSVSALLDPTGGAFQYLKLNTVSHPTSGSWNATDLGMLGLEPTKNADCGTRLAVPATYSAQGSETATLVFLATSTP